MKKIYSLLAAAFVGAAGLTAQADDVTFTLKVDNPGSVTWQIGDDEGTLTEESTKFTCEDPGWGVYVTLQPTGDYNIVSVTDANGTSAGYVAVDYASFKAEANGEYTITTVDISATRTASFTLNSDNYEAVVVSYPNGINIPLESNSQIIKFNPETENHVYVNAKDYDKPLFSVQVDGVSIEAPWGSYDVPITDGCVVDVVSEYPDIDFTVNITYGEGCEGFFSSASVNRVPVADFDGKSFTAKAGAYVTLRSDDDWILDKMTINGVNNPYYYGTYSFNISEDMEFYVEAHKPGMVEFTIDIDNPEAVTVFQRDFNWNEIPFNLVAGPNKLTVSELDRDINFSANAGYVIDSVTDQEGEDYSRNDWFSARNGYTYTFVTKKLTLDDTAVIYVDDVNIDSFRAQYDVYSTRLVLDLKSGYNVVPFNVAQNPFAFSWYNTSFDDGQAYLNGEKLNPQYGNVMVDMKNNDVVKLFMVAAPVECVATFAVGEGVEATVTRDIVVEVPDYEAGFTAFNGTQINIAGENIEVYANDARIYADENDEFVIVLEADTEIAINSTMTGVAAIEAAANAPVFNLQGVKVGTRGSIKSLPAGIYVMDGRKVTVK